MITREQIEARLQQLQADREKLIGNLSAYNGAIEDCQYWLGQLDAPEATDETPQDS